MLTDPINPTTTQIKQGDIVIPVAKTLQQPPQLVALGLYVGVEYRILGISVLQEPQVRTLMYV